MTDKVKVTNQKFVKLKELLMELFQLDQPELDFGFYRVMHARAKEVTQFLEKDLLPQVAEVFEQYQSVDAAGLQEELEQAITQAKALGADPDTLPKVKELKSRLSTTAVDISRLESEVYDHLYTFFRRYYHEGDFLSKRVYRDGVYAIPYSGEEVKLHWANADQYYIKTDEYLKDYSFRLNPSDDKNPMRVHFRISAAKEGEHGNAKAADNAERRFILAADNFIFEEDGEQGRELVLSFEYRPSQMSDWPEDQRSGKKTPPAQKDLLQSATRRILEFTDPSFLKWLKLLQASAPSVQNSSRTILEKNLDRYTKRNTFDYFIHKDLGGFLRRELDFYIKNEVMHLDDIENETASKVEQYLSKTKAIRTIAGKLIEFLAQLENFQKKLLLKQKFVVETNYIISLDKIPEEFYPEIAANTAQIREWIELCEIDSAAGDLLTPGYTEPLSVKFLRGHKWLPVDLTFFSVDFRSKVLASIPNLNNIVIGTLFHGDNLQALRLMRRRLESSIHAIYIDPPFNLKQNGDFLYRTDYKDSTWLTLLADRLRSSLPLLSSGGFFFGRCDINGNFLFRALLNQVFGENRFLAELLVQRIRKNVTSQGRISLPLANDSLFLYALNEDYVFLNPYVRLSKTREKYWRRIDDSAGYRNPPERTIFGKVFLPYKRDAHFKFSQSTIDRMILERRIRLECKECATPHSEGTWERCAKCGGLDAVPKYLVQETDKKILDTNWTDISGYSSSTGFSTENSEALLERAIELTTDEDDIVLDYFAGSGTTLAVATKKARRWIGVEVGDQISTFIIPRLKSISKKHPLTFKYVRLESYEDALNNLAILEANSVQLNIPLGSSPQSRFKEEYFLKYLLDTEAKGSQSLLNINDFQDPFAYKMKIKRPGTDESREVNVDLLETFNWLLGLTVDHISVPRTFNTTFKRDSEGRLILATQLKQAKDIDDAPWWFRTVSGKDSEGRRVLVIWRKRPGGDTAEGIEQDNLVLNEWFRKLGFSTKDSEFDVIYVNGSSNLENVRTPDERWKVRLIEEDFMRLMFDVEEV